MRVCTHPPLPALPSLRGQFACDVHARDPTRALCQIILSLWVPSQASASVACPARVCSQAQSEPVAAHGHGQLCFCGGGNGERLDARWSAVPQTKKSGLVWSALACAPLLAQERLLEHVLALLVYLALFVRALVFPSEHVVARRAPNVRHLVQAGDEHALHFVWAWVARVSATGGEGVSAGCPDDSIGPHPGAFVFSCGDVSCLGLPIVGLGGGGGSTACGATHFSGFPTTTFST